MVVGRAGAGGASVDRGRTGTGSGVNPSFLGGTGGPKRRAGAVRVAAGQP